MDNGSALNVINDLAANAQRTSNLIEQKRNHVPIKSDNWNFPVEEIPLYGKVKVLTDNGEKELDLPTRMKGIVRKDTNQIISCVSDKYALVPHSQIIDVVDSNLNKNFDYDKTTYLTHNGARMFSEYRLQGYDKSISEGDDVRLNFIVRNSYDASGQLAIMLQGLRLLCLNGLMGMGNLFHFVRRHVGDIKINSDISSEISSAIKSYNESLFPFWKQLSQKELNKDFGIDIIKDVSEKNVLPVKYEEEVKREWELNAQKMNAWFLYNCYTMILTHVIKRKSYENYLNLSRKIGAYFKTRFIG